MCGDLGTLIGRSIWFILPAYVANAAPVVVGGGRPLDGGRKMSDGRPVFGPGKTVRGLVGGLMAGFLVGVIQFLITLSAAYLVQALLMSAGALSGDLLGSFMKRRMGVPRGGAAPLLDQLGFLAFALLFVAPLAFPGWDSVVVLVVITPPLHLATNFLGYRAGLKSRPY
ncbi:MAG: CDP-2,3-bis-(O-geranylgeranyl)-sn-glycerol synthase [Candidatus Hadarchaeales archaeon]